MCGPIGNNTHYVFMPCTSVNTVCSTLQAAYDTATAIADVIDMRGDEIAEMQVKAKNSCHFGNAMAFLSSFIGPLLMIYGWKKKVLELRGQCIHSFYIEHKPGFTPVSTCCLTAAMLSFLLLGYALLFLTFAMLYAVLAFDQIRIVVWDIGYPYAATYLFTMLLNSYLVEGAIFGAICDEEHPEMLKHPKLFDFMSLIMIFLQLPLQTLASVTIVYLFSFGICSLFRLDLSMLPSGLESLDGGFTAFAAVTMMHERQNSPLVLVFCDSICNPGFTHYMDQVTRSWIEDRKPANRARNRWHLALLLVQNPSLRKYRKQRLYVKPEGEEEVPIDLMKMGMDKMSAVKGMVQKKSPVTDGITIHEPASGMEMMPEVHA